ncbi:MAG: phosphatase PAP2 family protein [Kiritimatiellaeota bacterium]|nr:phosphatase PAP2 family protein [Kiritimatiellota bacterium]
MLETLDKLNIDAFEIVNSMTMRNVMLDAVNIVSAECMPYLFICLLLYLWFSERIRDARRAVLLVLETLALGMSINFIITILYFHPRPFMMGLGVQLISHATETSFPSDHATFMLAVACMLLALRNTRKVGVIALATGLIGGFSRVYCGIHFPLDIVGSFVVAVFAATIIYASKSKLRPFNNYLLAVYERNRLNVRIISICRNIKYHIKLCELILEHESTPTMSKALIALAVGYAAMPFDLIPDFIPVLGQLDDVVIIPLLIFLAYKLVPSEVFEECRDQSGN